MARINRKHVDGMARRLNELLGLPTDTYVLNEETGRYEAQIGCIHVCGENGGNSVYQLSNEAGGCKGLAYGLSTREAYEWLSAAATGAQMAKGMEACK